MRPKDFEQQTRYARLNKEKAQFQYLVRPFAEGSSSKEVYGVERKGAVPSF
jgi:hypothetical protein